MADIKLNNIVKIYGAKIKKGSSEIPEGKRAVDDVNLEVKSGSFTVLVGPSGCGKTTLLRMIAGLESITAGNIQIGEVDITHLQPGDRGLAMVFQSYALYPHMTIRQNIEFGLLNARIPKFEIKERTDEALKIVGLSEYERRRPANLSGGQRQRVALARAIAKMPECFLMDEPLSNLDAKLRSEMRSELIQLHKRLEATFIYVTHDQIEAMTMGDNIVVMNEGEIMQQGSPNDIHNNPNSVFVAKFIGDPGMNIVEIGEGCKVGFRPRDVMFDSQTNRDDIVNVVGKVLSYENHGSEYLYYIENEGSKFYIKEMAKDKREADEIIFSIKSDNLYMFDENDKRIYDDEKIKECYGTFKRSWQKV